MMKWIFVIGFIVGSSLIEAKQEWPIGSKLKNGYPVKVISHDPLIYKLELPNNQTSTSIRQNVDKPARQKRFLEPEMDGKNLPVEFVRKRRCHHHGSHLKMKRNTPTVEDMETTHERTTELSEVTPIYEEMNYLPEMSPYDYRLLNNADRPNTNFENRRIPRHKDNIPSDESLINYKNHVTPREAPYEPITNQKIPENSAEEYKIVDMSQPNGKDFETLKHYLNSVHERQLESHKRYQNQYDRSKYYQHPAAPKSENYYPPTKTQWGNEDPFREGYLSPNGENYIHDSKLEYKSPYYSAPLKSPNVPKINENSQVFTSELEHLPADIEKYLDPKKLYYEALNSLINRNLPNNRSTKAQERKTVGNLNDSPQNHRTALEPIRNKTIGYAGANGYQQVSNIKNAMEPIAGGEKAQHMTRNNFPGTQNLPELNTGETRIQHLSGINSPVVNNPQNPNIGMEYYQNPPVVNSAYHVNPHIPNRQNPPVVNSGYHANPHVSSNQNPPVANSEYNANPHIPNIQNPPVVNSGYHANTHVSSNQNPPVANSEYNANPQIPNSQHPPVVNSGYHANPHVSSNQNPPVVNSEYNANPHIPNSQNPQVVNSAYNANPHIPNNQHPPVVNSEYHANPHVSSNQNPPVVNSEYNANPHIPNSQNPPVLNSAHVADPHKPQVEEGRYKNPPVVNPAYGATLPNLQNEKLKPYQNTPVVSSASVANPHTHNAGMKKYTNPQVSSSPILANPHKPNEKVEVFQYPLVASSAYAYPHIPNVEVANHQSLPVVNPVYDTNAPKENSIVENHHNLSKTSTPGVNNAGDRYIHEGKLPSQVEPNSRIENTQHASIVHSPNFEISAMPKPNNYQHGQKINTPTLENIGIPNTDPNKYQQEPRVISPNIENIPKQNQVLNSYQQGSPVSSPSLATIERPNYKELPRMDGQLMNTLETLSAAGNNYRQEPRANFPTIDTISGQNQRVDNYQLMPNINSASIENLQRGKDYPQTTYPETMGTAAGPDAVEKEYHQKQRSNPASIEINQHPHQINNPKIGTEEEANFRNLSRANSHNIENIPKPNPRPNIYQKKSGVNSPTIQGSDEPTPTSPNQKEQTTIYSGHQAELNHGIQQFEQMSTDSKIITPNSGTLSRFEKIRANKPGQKSETSVNLKHAQTQSDLTHSPSLKHHESIQQESHLTPKEIEFYNQPSPNVLLMDHIPANIPNEDKVKIPVNLDTADVPKNKVYLAEVPLDANVPFVKQVLGTQHLSAPKKKQERLPINNVNPSDPFLPPNLDVPKKQYQVIQHYPYNSAISIPPYRGKETATLHTTPPVHYENPPQIESPVAQRNKQVEFSNIGSVQNTAEVPVEESVPALLNTPIESKMVQDNPAGISQNIDQIESEKSQYQLGNSEKMLSVQPQNYNDTKMLNIENGSENVHKDTVSNQTDTDTTRHTMEQQPIQKQETKLESVSTKKVITNPNLKLKEHLDRISKDRVRVSKGKSTKKYLTKASTIPIRVQKLLLQYIPKNRQNVTPTPIIITLNTTEPIQETSTTMVEDVRSQTNEATLPPTNTKTIPEELGKDAPRDKLIGTELLSTTTERNKNIPKSKLSLAISKQEKEVEESQKPLDTVPKNKTKSPDAENEDAKKQTQNSHTQKKNYNKENEKKIQNVFKTDSNQKENIGTERPSTTEESLGKTVANEILELQKIYLDNLPPNMLNHEYGFYHSSHHQNATEIPSYSIVLDENKKLRSLESDDKKSIAEYPIQYIRDHIKTGDNFQIVEENSNLNEETISSSTTTTDKGDYSVMFDGENTNSEEEKIKDIVSLIRKNSKKNEYEDQKENNSDNVQHFPKDIKTGKGLDNLDAEDAIHSDSGKVVNNNSVEPISNYEPVKNYAEKNKTIEDFGNQTNINNERKENVPFNSEIAKKENLGNQTKESNDISENKKGQKPLKPILMQQKTEESTTKKSKPSLRNKDSSLKAAKPELKPGSLDSIMEQLKKIIIPFDPKSKRKIIFIDPNKFNQKAVKVIEIPDKKEKIVETIANQFDPFENDELAKSSPDTESSENNYEHSEESYEDYPEGDPSEEEERDETQQRSPFQNVGKQIQETEKGTTEKVLTKLSPPKFQFPNIKEQIKWSKFPNSGIKTGNFDRLITQRSTSQISGLNQNESLSSPVTVLTSFQQKLAQQKEERKKAAEARSQALKEFGKAGTFKDDLAKSQNPIDSSSNTNGAQNIKTISEFPIGSIHIHNPEEPPVDATDPAALFGYNKQPETVQKRSCSCGSYTGELVGNTCQCSLKNKTTENYIKDTENISNNNKVFNDIQSRIANQRKIFKENKNLKKSEGTAILGKQKKSSKCALCKDCSSESFGSEEVTLGSKQGSCACGHNEIQIVKVSSDKLKAMKQNGCSCGKDGGCSHNELLKASAPPKDDPNKYDILNNVLLWLKQYTPKEQ